MNRGTTVFVTFLDASKAFDRLNYWLLFDKLVKKCVPLFIIKLLCFWYTHKKMVVRWGTTISTQFTVANGVKQSGIISPILFNMYMDDLSIALTTLVLGDNNNNNIYLKSNIHKSSIDYKYIHMYNKIMLYT